MTPRSPANSRRLPPVAGTGVLFATLLACSLVSYRIELSSVTVRPADLRIAGTTMQQLTATARYSDDSERDVTGAAAWISSNLAVATVSGGLVTPAQPGTTTITARMDGRSGSTTVTVTDARLQSIDVTPANPSIANGTRVQLGATGHFDDGTAQDLTATVAWTSSDASVEVGNGPGSGGLATSGALGAASATVTATMGTVSGATLVTVRDVTLASVSVTPAAPSIQLGQTQAFAATGTFSDGATQTMTREVTWDSSTPSVATIDASGRATGVFAGTTAITATSSALLGAVSGTAQLTVKTVGGGY